MLISKPHWTASTHYLFHPL